MDASQSEERMGVWKYLIRASRIGVQYWRKRRYFVLEAYYLISFKFCAKGEMSSGLKSNPKGEAVRGVKVTTASVTRVGISSDMKISSNKFDKPVVFDKSGSWPKVSYKFGPYYLRKPLVDVDQDTVLEYIFDEKLNPLEAMSNPLDVKEFITHNLDEVLKGEIASTKTSGWALSKFFVKTPQTVPQQPNLYDCCVFAINIMENRDMSDITSGKELEDFVCKAMRHHEMRCDDCIGYGA
ncbi:hypothetical protein TIFTF001_027458 [Ficus carica]|uniref:Ubiquitin-like protease family profile domain-containing protein n=1 Tax=Ficus carica TaxID=3494 RepID=A0AA88DN40_FICCA|nr:hypothetical protein TIFTF001_027458 [Ficus carica]